LEGILLDGVLLGLSLLRELGWLGGRGLVGGVGVVQILTGYLVYRLQILEVLLYVHCALTLLVKHGVLGLLLLELVGLELICLRSGL